jgi:hypothetical protein
MFLSVGVGGCGSGALPGIQPTPSALGPGNQAEPWSGKGDIENLSESIVRGKEQEIEETTQIALGLLQEKYGEAFELVDIGGSVWGQTGGNWRFKPEGGDDDTVFSGLILKENGKYTLNDGYYCVLIRDEYTEKVREIVAEEFKTFKLSVRLPADALLAPEVNKNVALLDVVKYNDKHVISIHSDIAVISSGEHGKEYEQKIQRVFDKLLKIGIGCYIDFYVVQPTHYEDANFANIREIDPVFYKKR